MLANRPERGAKQYFVGGFTAHAMPVGECSQLQGPQYSEPPLEEPDSSFGMKGWGIVKTANGSAFTQIEDQAKEQHDTITGASVRSTSSAPVVEGSEKPMVHADELRPSRSATRPSYKPASRSATTDSDFLQLF